MATYRQIHIQFWQDSFVLDLSPEEKFFYLYLMTNSKTTQCGIYELPKKIIELETGFNRKLVDEMIKKFIDYGKILYNEYTKEIMVINWLKYNPINSESIRKCVEKELLEVKSPEYLKLFKTLCQRYGYEVQIPSISMADPQHTPYTPPTHPIHTPTTPQGEEKEEEKEINNNISSEILSSDETDDALANDDTKKNKVPYKEIITLYNEICVSLPKVKEINEKRKKQIRARWKRHPDLNYFQELFKKTEASDFLTGRNGKWTGCNFDWLMNENNSIKVLEGTYDNKASPLDTKTIDYEKASQSKYGW